VSTGRTGTFGDSERPSGRALVAASDGRLGFRLASGLRAAGYAVEQVGDAAELLAAVVEWPVDLVVLQFDLPSLADDEVLRRLRVRATVPVLAVSAGEPEHRDAVFDLDADDYLVQPFTDRELQVRSASARRSARRSDTSRMVFAGLEIDTRARRVLVSEREVAVTPREYALLAYLARNPSAALSREELLREVWPSKGEWQDPDTVTEHVRRLRLKLTAAGLVDDWVTTIRGYGYRFDLAPRDGTREAS
jgi:DNA-binding response OmpR family regulator